MRGRCDALMQYDIRDFVDIVIHNALAPARHQISLQKPTQSIVITILEMQLKMLPFLLPKDIS